MPDSARRWRRVAAVRPHAVTLREMPKFYFRISATHSVAWHFDRHPEEGELIAFGDAYGICQVGKRLPPSDQTVDAEYDVIRVRGMTDAERVAVAKGDAAFLLPPRGRSYSVNP